MSLVVLRRILRRKRFRRAFVAVGVILAVFVSSHHLLPLIGHQDGDHHGAAIEMCAMALVGAAALMYLAKLRSRPRQTLFARVWIVGVPIDHPHRSPLARARAGPPTATVVLRR